MNDFWQGFLVGQLVWLVPFAIAGLVWWIKGDDDGF